MSRPTLSLVPNSFWLSARLITATRARPSSSALVQGWPASSGTWNIGKKSAEV